MSFVEVRTSSLIGPALDWAVAKCEGREPVHYLGVVRATAHPDYPDSPPMFGPDLRYSTNWAQGGPIIEREGINLSVDYQDDALSTDMIQIGWKGNLWNNSVPGTAGFLQWAYGPHTPHRSDALLRRFQAW